MTNKINKLIKKEHLGYRYTTVDLVTIESNNEKQQISIDDINKRILFDMTPQTIEMLYEFFRYLHTDQEEIKNGEC